MNKAKINGNVLEKAVISVFDEYCVPTIKSNEMVTGHFLMRKPPFINLYGSVSRTGFLLKIRGRKPIRIITQWQQVGGTADEKLPYVLANCLKFNKAFKTNSIIILDGDGFKPDAKEWLIREAKKCKGIKVYSLKQFISWANKYLEKVK